MCIKRKRMPGCRGCVPPCGQQFLVNGCNGQAYYVAVTVSIYASEGGELLASGVASGGSVRLSWAGTSSPYVTVTGASARFQAYGQSLALTCGGLTTLTLVPASGYYCIPTCVLPTTGTLSLTDAVAGTTTISYTSGYTWVGTLVYSYVSDDPGICPNASVTLTYSVTFNEDGSASYVFSYHGTINETYDTICPDDGPDGPYIASGPMTVVCPPSLLVTLSSIVSGELVIALVGGAGGTVTVSE